MDAASALTCNDYHLIKQSIAGRAAAMEMYDKHINGGLMQGLSGYLRMAGVALGAAFIISVFPCPSLAAPPLIDRESTECIGCHEANVMLTGDEQLTVCHSGGDCGHPIAINYAALSAMSPVLVKAADLNPAVRLVNGRIGCATCHVPYSEADHEAMSAQRADTSVPDPLLVMDNAGSALCAACHKK